MDQVTAPPRRRSPLVDQRAFTRTVVVIIGVGLGVTLGYLGVLLAGVSTTDAPLWLQFVPILAGSGMSIVASLSTAVYSIRADRAMRRALADGGGEIASGAVTAGPALPARVVRRRVVAGKPTVGIDARLPRPVAATSSLAIVVDVLLPDETRPAASPTRAGAATGGATGSGAVRRVVVLTPHTVPLGALAKGSTHLVRLHPARDDVGVLDVTGDPAALAAASHDPRWATATRPSSGAVVGGWGVLALIGVVALLGGAAAGVGLALYGASFTD